MNRPLALVALSIMVSVAMSLLVTILVKTLPRRKLREKEVES